MARKYCRQKPGHRLVGHGPAIGGAAQESRMTTVLGARGMHGKSVVRHDEPM